MSDPIPESLARFITSHISIHAAASADGAIATLVRGLGCRIDPAEPDQVRILLPRSQSLALLDAVAANGRVAVVLNEPESHRTVQLKSTRACVVPSDAEDQAVLAPYRNAMAQRLKLFDTPEPFVHTLLTCAQGDLVILRFAPEAVFGQTPGPRAGAPMAADAPIP